MFCGAHGWIIVQLFGSIASRIGLIFYREDKKSIYNSDKTAYKNDWINCDATYDSSDFREIFKSLKLKDF